MSDDGTRQAVDDLNPAFGVRVASAEAWRATFQEHADMASQMASQAIIAALAAGPDGENDTLVAAYESAASVHATLAGAAAYADPYSGEQTGTIRTTQESRDARDR